ncbi:hypothetical protein Hanom_Chr15g01352871 [Helianthus anomalus]
MYIMLFDYDIHCDKMTEEVWSTSFAADVCRCGSQTADILPLKKQTAPKY